MLLITIGCLQTSQAKAQTTPDTADLTTAFVYNFMVFAKWPVISSKQLNLCIAGQNRDSLQLQKLQGKTVQKRQVQIIPVTDAAELWQCQTLFVAASQYADLLDAAPAYPLLSITNIIPDNGRAAALQLATVNGRLIFDVNLQHLKQSGVNLSASVLRLARRSTQ
ncbi:YfiR family protein [Thiomicrorhabdus cannonii]|uniref:YfiR family protein n=1 Tax=Thiomicrorhabdus cannonii TaxID=2748011 RepID=UPI0015BB1CEC|nr:YfiR family protein [Thiomicrorhabdus cannonii]